MNEDVNCYLPLPFCSELGILNSIFRELNQQENLRELKGIFILDKIKEV